MTIGNWTTWQWQDSSRWFFCLMMISLPFVRPANITLLPPFDLPADTGRLPRINWSVNDTAPRFNLPEDVNSSRFVALLEYRNSSNISVMGHVRDLYNLQESNMTGNLMFIYNAKAPPRKDTVNIVPQLLHHINSKESAYVTSFQTEDIREPTANVCNFIYGCIFYHLNYHYEAIGSPLDLPACLDAGYLKFPVRNDNGIRCPLSFGRYEGDPVQSRSRCASTDYAVTQDNWSVNRGNDLIDVLGDSGFFSGLWIQGARKVHGVEDPQNLNSSTWWPSKRANLDNIIGARLLGQPTFSCGLERPCRSQSTCEDVGIQTFVGIDSVRIRDVAASLVVQSVENLSSQLSNQYIAIKGAAISAALKTFKIQDFYDKPPDRIKLFDILEGLGFAFALVGGFAPGLVAAGSLGAASSAISAVGGFLGRRVKSSFDFAAVVQANYADSVDTLYQSYVRGLNEFAKALFNGSSLSSGNNATGNFSLYTMLKDAAWLPDSTISQVDQNEQAMTMEIVSRSINNLWRQGPSNKVFTIFTDLRDAPDSTAKCQNHTRGPQPMKYSADGGVYYTYYYKEDSIDGRLTWPKGADTIQDKSKIDPAWITESSARTYQLAKAQPDVKNIFNITDDDFAKIFLNSTVAQTHYGRFTAGRGPGTWTIPVCNAWVQGMYYNVDYTKTQGLGFFPCYCGGHQETKDWVKAAGLFNFLTFYNSCSNQMRDPSRLHLWPEGVTQIDLGFKELIKKPK